MNTQLKVSESPSAATDRGWYSSYLLREQPPWLARLAAWLRQTREHMGRRRRRLARSALATLAGASLLLALSQPAPVGAATINVVNGEVAIVQNGKCSLMEAIINARATRPGQLHDDCAAGNLNGPDTILLPVNGEFVLTEAHNSQFGSTGLPVITNDMTIDGRGSTISGGGDYPYWRALAIDPGVDFTLQETTISHASSEFGYGGGILNYGDLTLVDSTLTGNYAYYGGGGLANIGEASSATIVRSIIDANFTGMEASGAGILNVGTLTVSESLIRRNMGNWYGSGGGIANFGMLIIVDSEISANHSAEAACIRNSGVATIERSLLANNLGGGYYGSCIENWYDDELTIVNSTLTGNEATFGSSAISNHGKVSVHGSTVSNNESYYDCAIKNSGELTLGQTIVSGNWANGRFLGEDNSPCEIESDGPIISAGHNVIGHDGNAYSHEQGWLDWTPDGPGDIVPDGPVSSIVNPLMDNGGPTWTQGLPAGSPAIDLVPNALCAADPVGGVDQRGRPRPANGDGQASNHECDAGAFERHAGPDQPNLFLSTLSGGKVSGLAFTPADILRYDPENGWSLFFDASDLGISRNVSAFALEPDGSVKLSFAANQPLTWGVARPQDIVSLWRYPWSANYPEWYALNVDVEGADVGLTTSGEKIDALALTPEGYLLSTVGAAAVRLPNNQVLRAADEDVLALSDAGAWSLFLDGSTVPGLKAEDINGLWVNGQTGEVYITLLGSFNLGGVRGNGKDIVKLTPNGAGGYTPSLFWDGSAMGFPRPLDGLEILP